MVGHRGKGGVRHGSRSHFVFLGNFIATKLPHETSYIYSACHHTSSHSPSSPSVWWFIVVLLCRACLQRLLNEAFQAGIDGRHGLRHHLTHCRNATGICRSACWTSTLTCAVARYTHAAGAPVISITSIGFLRFCSNGVTHACFVRCYPAGRRAV